MQNPRLDYANKKNTRVVFSRFWEISTSASVGRGKLRIQEVGGVSLKARSMD